jgi:hypothetical protein
MTKYQIIEITNCDESIYYIIRRELVAPESGKKFVSYGTLDEFGHDSYYFPAFGIEWTQSYKMAKRFLDQDKAQNVLERISENVYRGKVVSEVVC